MRIFNTLGRRLEAFEPADPPHVGIYVCGPTVQSDPHVGHGRAAVAFDVVRRYLLWRGFDVTYVRNVTDVEDKIIAAAGEQGVGASDLAEEMAGRFSAAYLALGALEPDVEPKATEHIPEMISLIERLVDRGLAYPSGGDVYFSVRSFERYGALSGRKPDELIAGSRIEVSDLKQDPLDFALWKAVKPGEPWWDSPWGPGRPGWHIECSAMAAKYLGDSFDIHGGGSDLVFPHHENELAQSEAATGTRFVRYWLHNGMVNLGGEKMAKSTGHVVGLQEAIDRYGGMAVRLFYLRAHYRSPLEYSVELLADAAAAYGRVARFLERAAGHEGTPDPAVMDRFTTVMDEDFGTPEALGVLFDAIRDANRALDEGGQAGAGVAAVHEMLGVLGLDGARPAADLADLQSDLAALARSVGHTVDGGAEATLRGLIDARASARLSRDFATADRIRDELARLGITLEDGADATRWLRS